MFFLNWKLTIASIALSITISIIIGLPILITLLPLMWARERIAMTWGQALAGVAISAVLLFLIWLGYYGYGITILGVFIFETSFGIGAWFPFMPIPRITYHRSNQRQQPHNFNRQYAPREIRPRRRHRV